MGTTRTNEVYGAKYYQGRFVKSVNRCNQNVVNRQGEGKSTLYTWSCRSERLIDMLGQIRLGEPFNLANTYCRSFNLLELP